MTTPIQSKNLPIFQHIIKSNDDQMIFADTRKDQELGYLKDNRSNRVVVWLRKALSRIRTGANRSYQRRDIEQAYDRFVSAISESQTRPDEQELDLVKASIASDKKAGKPLTSRKIREVVGEIAQQDGQSSPTTLLRDRSIARRYVDTEYLRSEVNRALMFRPALAALAGEKALAALADEAPLDFSVDALDMVVPSEQELAALSKKVYSRLMAEGAASQDGITPDEATEIVLQEVEQMLQDYENSTGLKACMDKLPARTRSDIATVEEHCNQVYTQTGKQINALEKSLQTAPCSDADRSKIQAQLAGSRNTVELMQHKLLDISAQLSDSNQLDEASQAMIRGLADRLNHLDDQIAGFLEQGLSDLEEWSEQQRPERLLDSPTADNEPEQIDDDIEEEPGAPSIWVRMHKETEALKADPRFQRLRQEYPDKIPDEDICKALQAYDKAAENPGPAAEALGRPIARALSPDEFAALYLYTAQHYTSMNAALRNQEGQGGFDPAWRGMAWRVADALSKLEKAGLVITDKPTFRGLPAKFYEGKKEGETIADTSFSSTSMNPTIAEEFAGRTTNRFKERQLLLHLFGQSGVPVFGELSNNPGEKEVLFRPDNQFRILLKAEQPQAGQREPITKIVAEEVGRDPRAGRSGVADALLDPAISTPAPRETADEDSRDYFDILYDLLTGRHEALDKRKSTGKRPSMDADALIDP